MGHAVMENRNGLAVAGTVTQADGTAERRAAEALLKRKARRRSRRITVGEDKAYDSRDHVTALRRMNVTLHVAQNDALTKTGRRRTSAIDKRPTRHVGYRISQSCRAMVECIFGWGKQHGTHAQDQAPWHRRCRRRLHAQSHRLQSRPYPKAHRCLSSDSARKAPSGYANALGSRRQPSTQGRNFSPRRFFSRLLAKKRLPPKPAVDGDESDKIARLGTAPLTALAATGLVT
jgi:hypothetical protein